MEVIKNIFDKIDDYFISLEKNFETNNYVVTIGIPVDWVIKTTDFIECVVEKENEELDGKLVKISTLDNEVTVENLLVFVTKLIGRNLIIEEKKKEYLAKIEEEKNKLKEETIKIYGQLESIKNADFDDDFILDNESNLESTKNEEIEDKN